MTQPEPSERTQPEHVSAERGKETVSTALDVLAMLAISVGVGWATAAAWGAWGIAAGGTVLAGLNLLSGWLRRPRTLPDNTGQDADVVPLRALPGPEDPGHLHISGG